jgi:hypothetical protein
VKKRPVPVSRRQSRRSLKKAVVYNDGIDEDDDEI